MSSEAYSGIVVGDRHLYCTRSHIQFGDASVSMDKVIGLTWYQRDHRLNGFLSHRTRDLIVADGTPQGFTLSFGGLTPIGDPDEQFWLAYHYLSRTLLHYLSDGPINKLVKEGQISIAGIALTHSGIIIPGWWRFLWMQGRPRLIRWLDVVVSFDREHVVVRSKVEPAKTVTIPIEPHIDALLADKVIRRLIKKISEDRTSE